MSILSEALNHRITWGQASSEIADWITKLLNKNQGQEAAIAQIQSELKQAASDALSIADTALGDIISAAVVGVVPALDAALLKYAGPVGLQAAPIVEDAVKRIADTMRSEVDMWVAKTRANLGAPN